MVLKNQSKDTYLTLINVLIHANHIPSQTNPVKVVWKVQRLILEDGNQ